MAVRLHPLSAIALNFCISGLYVAILYIVPCILYTSWPRRLPRNHSITVKRRLWGVAVFTFICVLLLLLVDSSPISDGRLSLFDPYSEFFFRGIGAALALVQFLYLGPTYLWIERLLASASASLRTQDSTRLPAWPDVVVRACKMLRWDLGREIHDISNWRDHVVGPLSEEVVFRGCGLAFFVAAGVGSVRIILLGPLIFGLAHTHHIFEVLLLVVYSGLRGLLLTATVVSVQQAIYTSLFGSFAAFIVLRTGHLSPAILAHMYCNFMGLPEVGAIRECTHPRASWILHVGGVVGFVVFLVWLVQHDLDGSWSPI